MIEQCSITLNQLRAVAVSPRTAPGVLPRDIFGQYNKKHWTQAGFTCVVGVCASEGVQKVAGVDPNRQVFDQHLRHKLASSKDITMFSSNFVCLW